MGSLPAYTSTQAAVTKEPGCAVFGEENTWLNDIHSLLATAKLQHCGPRPRIPVTVRPLNKRRHANDIPLRQKLLTEARQ